MGRYMHITHYRAMKIHVATIRKAATAKIVTDMMTPSHNGRRNNKWLFFQYSRSTSVFRLRKVMHFLFYGGNKHITNIWGIYHAELLECISISVFIDKAVAIKIFLLEDRVQCLALSTCSAPHCN